MLNKNKDLEILRKKGLKPTFQRIILSKILFNGQDMHFCADDLKSIISKKGYKMSLATIYNNLQNFADVGLLKRRRVSNSKVYYDNNISHHYHFYDEQQNKLIDIPTSGVEFKKLPKLPKDKKVTSIDLFINIKKK